MVALSEKFAGGMPVELGRIERELKTLWEGASGMKTRASLINLAVYSDDPDSLTRNTEWISKITEEHACRAIVIGAEPEADETGVQAWISAHCHVTRTGAKQVCSEQLSFLLSGESARQLPSIVFSHLDSDLPFYLWWQEEFPEPIDPQLWAWVDRVIYDSNSWGDFGSQIRLVETAQAEAKQRIVLCDLNWNRLLHLRIAIAQFFDHPSSHFYFKQIERVEIEHAPEYRRTALLLAGWLAAQLRWQLEVGTKNGRIQFRDSSKRKIKVSLTEKAGEPISRCVLSCGKVEFRVAHSPGTDLLNVCSGAPGEEPAHQFMPAGDSDVVSLVGEELMRGGPHRVYLRTVGRVREIL